MFKLSIIGSGFSGLSAACFAARAGHQVTVFEKNDTHGGRARSFSDQGFLFDMGPSWYWMPDVFEKFFNSFGKSCSDYYQLVKTNPAFQVIYRDNETIQIPNTLEELYEVFESIEEGSAKQLKKFLAEGEMKYKIAMESLIYKPAFTPFEYASYDVFKGALHTDILSSMSTYVRRFFKNEKLISLMEFPVLFLGALPEKIPALYSLMNYAAFSMGTWYPLGGMCKIVEAMHELGRSIGVEYKTQKEIKEIIVSNGKVNSLVTGEGFYNTDALIATGDYHHIESRLLLEKYRNYSNQYWDERTMAPSCLIFYLGISKKINGLVHHNLFFDADFNKHAEEIYRRPQWPADPLFYVCCPSKTDDSVAPNGMENLFILIPLAAGIKDEKALHEIYFDKVIDRIEKKCGEKIKTHILSKRSYCLQDFEKDYNAYKGNAYGLANTLGQTAFMKPSMRNKKVKNLFYAGQLTVPGPGVPPALISGQIAAEQVIKYFGKTNRAPTPKRNESTF
mgnify:CR=1 FL=1